MGRGIWKFAPQLRDPACAGDFGPTTLLTRFAEELRRVLGIWRVYRLGIADEDSCLEELDDELFFFDFTALRFSHSSSLRGRSPAFSRSVLFLW